jgi:hypothetical protein
MGSNISMDFHVDDEVDWAPTQISCGIEDCSSVGAMPRDQTYMELAKEAGALRAAREQEEVHKGGAAPKPCRGGQPARATDREHDRQRLARPPHRGGFAPDRMYIRLGPAKFPK